jgi:hypothetical protein
MKFPAATALNRQNPVKNKQDTYIAMNSWIELFNLVLAVLESNGVPSIGLLSSSVVFSISGANV